MQKEIPDHVVTKSGTPFGGPGNAGSGIAYGFGTIAGGFAIGGVALVAAPVMLAKEKGPLGAVAGVAAGVAGLGLSVGIGVLGGGAKMVQGVFNTPAAIAAIAAKDDLYGKEQIDLAAVSAEKHAEEERYGAAREKVERASSIPNDLTGNEYKPTKDVAETEYYGLLGKPPDASAAELKRAYYKLAMKQHPDKGGDKEAFQKLGTAYQTLSDPEKRAKYDKFGAKSLDPGQMADPAVRAAPFCPSTPDARTHTHPATHCRHHHRHDRESSLLTPAPSP